MIRPSKSVVIDGQYKICNKCGEKIHFDDMIKDNRCHYGIGGHCKTCERIRSTAKRKPNKEYHKKYRKQNRDKINTYNNKRRKEPKHNLNHRMSSAMYFGLKNNKANLKWESLVPYTLSELMEHLEILFASGMTWENMGEWHIDHKIPKSWFTYDSHTDQEFQDCWALENLQPLWAEENYKKNNKFRG